MKTIRRTITMTVEVFSDNEASADAVVREIKENVINGRKPADPTTTAPFFLSEPE